MKEHLRANRRPAFFVVVSIVCLVLHHVLVRAMAHGHIAHVLLGRSPPASAATLAIALVIVRVITVMLVPGLLLAAAAEVTAYLLVGPPRERD
jgi:hypothetical protein